VDSLRLMPAGPAPKKCFAHDRSHDFGKEEWLTPPDLIRQLGPFDLDPCAPVNRPWDTAAKHYTVLDDGLLNPWHGRVWLNPPYGPETGKWLAKMAHHGNGVALVFARTETAAFHEHVWPRASALLFLRGRLTFHHVDGTPGPCSAGAPSVLIAYGGGDAERLRELQNLGAYVGMTSPRTPATLPLLAGEVNRDV